MQIINNTKYQAALFMLLSALFYSIEYYNVKSISCYYGIWTIGFVRGLSGILPVFLTYFCKPIKPIYGYEIKKLFIFGLISGISIIASFFAVKNLNLSLASLLLSTSTLMTGIFSSFYNKKLWNVYDTIGTILCIFGLITIIYKGFKNTNDNYFIGILSSVVYIIFCALANITIMEKVKEENTLVITLYAGASSMILSTFGMINENINRNIVLSTNLIKLFVIGILSFCTLSFRIKSIQISNTLGVIILRYTNIIWTLLLDIFLLHSHFNYYDAVGIILILLGCFISYHKYNN